MYNATATVFLWGYGGAISFLKLQFVRKMLLSIRFISASCVYAPALSARWRMAMRAKTVKRAGVRNVRGRGGLCLFLWSLAHAAGPSLERPSCLMGRPFVWRCLTAPDGHRLWINKQRPTMQEQTINSTCRRERRRMSERGADWFARAGGSRRQSLLHRDATRAGTWSVTRRSVIKSALQFLTSVLTAPVETGDQGWFPRSQNNRLLDMFTQTQWRVGNRTAVTCCLVSPLQLAGLSRDESVNESTETWNRSLLCH